MIERCLRLWNYTADHVVELRRIWLPLYFLLFLIPVITIFLPDSPVRFTLQAVGNIWLGFYMYFSLFLVIFLIPAEIIRHIRHSHGRALHGMAICLSLISTTCFVCYGLVHAQHIMVTRWKISLGEESDESKEMKLAIIGDLHLGVNSRLSTTQQMIELINEEEPDAVLVAGDIFTSSYGGLQNSLAYAEAFRGIHTKYGVYAVYGNHDVEETLFGGFSISSNYEAFRTPEMESFVENCGFTILEDKAVVLGNDIQLYGRLDGKKTGNGTTNRLSAAELLAGADPLKPIIVLQHEPKEFYALAKAGADVALCAHTHNGQIFPGNLIIPFYNENAYGYSRVNGLHTFVTAGIGYYGPPMRIGTDSEIMILTLRY